jgi:glyoxylase I family protein
VKIHHLALATPDPVALARFYVEVLGLSVLTEHRDDAGVRSVWLALDGSVLMLERSGEPPVASSAFMSKRPGFHLLALRIEAQERQARKESLVSRGITIEHESDYSLYFLDPEGNRVAFSHYPDLPRAGVSA